MADALILELRRLGRLTNPDARSVLGISDPAVARRILQRLVTRGEADRRGAGHGTHYVPT